MTVLVTGAAGFLGSHVTRLLADAGDPPRVLVRPGEPIAPLVGRGCEIHRGDLADRGSLMAAVRGVDLVLNCAARTGPWGPQADYERSNVLGLETLVRAGMAAGVRRLVHVSSITVHGNDVHGAADEFASLRSEPNPYSRTKVAGERLLRRMMREGSMPITIVRPGWIYGPGDHASFGRLAQRIADEQMVVVGRGDNRLPLIYVRDAARGVLLAGQAERAEGRSYLLVNDEPVTQRDFVAAIAEELGVPQPTRHIPYPLARSLGAAAETAWRLARRREAPPVMRYGIQLLGGENRFVIARAREELGFVPLVDLAQGVAQSVAWYRGDGEPAHLSRAAA
jgi:nucleoside-diphosphate-sugar epimerase